MRPAHLPLLTTLVFEGSVFSADSQENSRLRETVHAPLLARLFDTRPGIYRNRTHDASFDQRVTRNRHPGECARRQFTPDSGRPVYLPNIGRDDIASVRNLFSLSNVELPPDDREAFDQSTRLLRRDFVKKPKFHQCPHRESNELWGLF